MMECFILLLIVVTVQLFRPLESKRRTSPATISQLVGDDAIKICFISMPSSFFIEFWSTDQRQFKFIYLFISLNCIANIQ